MSPAVPSELVGSVTSPLPTRSKIENWDITHLEDAETRWRQMADESERLFEQHVHNLGAPGGTDWEGQARDAAYQRGLTDLGVVQRQNDILRACADIAAGGRTDVSNARRKALDAIAAAEQDGFSVGEDLTVTDSRPRNFFTQEARQIAATEYAEDIRWHAEQLEATDNLVGKRLTEKAAELHDITFDEHGHDRHIQMVDSHTYKDAPGDAPVPPTDGTSDPAGTFGLPNYNPGSLSEAEARAVYLQGELRMRELNDRLARQGASAEERAKTMFAQRNTLRSWARELMSNRALADQLNATEPHMSFEDLVAKYQAKGLTGDALYDAIIESATRSRASVNESLGIDPAHPPPLPPVHPSAPVEGAGPGTAPVISPPPVLPSIGEHSPVALPPTETSHPPVAIPPTVLDHPPLPPWLQDSSPPGFHATPSQPPDVFNWDMPDPPPAPPPMPPPAGSPVTIPSPLPPGAGPAAGAGAVAGGLGAWILSNLSKLPHLLTIPSP